MEMMLWLTRADAALAQVEYGHELACVSRKSQE
jgi:hypothetical protein